MLQYIHTYTSDILLLACSQYEGGLYEVCLNIAHVSLSYLKLFQIRVSDCNSFRTEVNSGNRCQCEPG